LAVLFCKKFGYNVMMQTENELFLQQKPTWKDVTKNLAFIVIAIGLAYYVTVYVGIDDVRTKVLAAGAWGPFIIILLKITTLVVVPLGGTPLYPIAGAIYGFWPALFMTAIGDILGFTIAFYLSRFFGSTILRFFMSNQQLPMVYKLVDVVSEKKTFLKARVFFAGFPELFAYAAGLTKVSYWLFIVAQMAVHIIGAGLLVVFGNALVSGNLPTVIGTTVVLTGLAFVGIWWFHANLKKSA
jgi:uncharacterized membrane protein YdjX (TVP38/TMEM64 family)